VGKINNGRILILTLVWTFIRWLPSLQTSVKESGDHSVIYLSARSFFLSFFLLSLSSSHHPSLYPLLDDV